MAQWAREGGVFKVGDRSASTHLHLRNETRKKRKGEDFPANVREDPRSLESLGCSFRVLRLLRGLKVCPPGRSLGLGVPGKLPG